MVSVKPEAFQSRAVAERGPRPKHDVTKTSLSIGFLGNQRRSIMVPTLPDDILHLLCEELSLKRDFDTLFNCAQANRGLAVPALTNLYR